MNHARMLLALALLTLMSAFPTSALLPAAFSQLNPSTTWFVAPSPTRTGTSGGSCKKPGFNTISAAIAAARGGDIINVCPGTYTEQLTISKSLTISSTKGASKTILQAPPTMTADSLGAVNIVTISGRETTAEFSGFTVDGPAPSSCGGGSIPFFDGIFVEGDAIATISDNTIQHIRNNPLDGDQCGRAILVGLVDWLDGAGVDTVGHATITNNVISDYQKSGIAVADAGSTATITGNKITGIGDTTVGPAQNGIEILGPATPPGPGAVTTINSNTISGNECDPSNDGCGPNLLNGNAQADGILLYNAPAGSKITSNTLSGNDVGIVLYQADSSTKVTGNTLTKNRYAGIALEDGTYTASSNTVTGPGNVGIAAVADSANTAVTISGNTISDYTATIGAYAGPTFTATIASS